MSHQNRKVDKLSDGLPKQRRGTQSFGPYYR